ncbi:MAG TPA: hypothetical protein VEH76_01195 [Methylocystis sp.]|nr:hypothetical protein [Methylocystis sp.]
MSLADKFENNNEPGFTRSFDPESARRQFHMSIVLVAAMGLAAFVLGFLSPTTSSSLKSPPVATDTPFTGRLVSIDR